MTAKMFDRSGSLRSLSRSMNEDEYYKSSIARKGGLEALKQEVEPIEVWRASLEERPPSPCQTSTHRKISSRLCVRKYN